LTQGAAGGVPGGGGIPGRVGVPDRGGVPGRDAISSGVGCLCQLRDGAPVPFRLHRVCGFFEVLFWEGWQLSVVLT